MHSAAAVAAALPGAVRDRDKSCLAPSTKTTLAALGNEHRLPCESFFKFASSWLDVAVFDNAL